MSDALPLTQDGGKSGELKEDSSSMRKARSLRFKTKTLRLMLNRETFKLQIEEKI